MNPNLSNYLVRGGLALVALGVVLAVLIPLLYPQALPYQVPALEPGDGLKTERSGLPGAPAAERRTAAARDALNEQIARVRDLERGLAKMSGGGPDQEQRQRELIVELNALAGMVTAELHAREIELIELKSEMARASIQGRDNPGLSAMGSAQVGPAAARADAGGDVSWFERAGQLGSFFGGISGMKLAWVIFAGGGLTGAGYLMQILAWIRRRFGAGVLPVSAS